jgi:hypothetical protein
LNFLNHVPSSPIIGAILTTVVEDYVRAAVVVILTIAVCYQLVANQPVNQELLSLFTLVLGYYFGRGVSNYKRAVSK